MKDFLLKFTSRKFLGCIAGIALVTAFPDLWEPIVAIVGIYCASEGAADVVQRYRQGVLQAEQTKQVTTAIENGLVPMAYKNPLTAGEPHVAGENSVQPTQFIPGKAQ